MNESGLIENHHHHHIWTYENVNGSSWSWWWSLDVSNWLFLVSLVWFFFWCCQTKHKSAVMVITCYDDDDHDDDNGWLKNIDFSLSLTFPPTWLYQTSKQRRHLLSVNTNLFYQKRWTNFFSLFFDIFSVFCSLSLDYIYHFSLFRSRQTWWWPKQKSKPKNDLWSAKWWWKSHS